MIIRGTTQDFEFGLPFDADQLAAAYVTVQQSGSTVIEKPLSDCTCEGNIVSVTLSQEETLRLSHEKTAEIGLVVRTVNNERLETVPIVKRVINTSKEGVI